MEFALVRQAQRELVVLQCATRITRVFQVITLEDIAADVFGFELQQAIDGRERRQHSAHTLIRELEDVTLRVEGAEDLHPYPGLASFTEEDAEYFFGREAEVEGERGAMPLLAFALARL